MGRYNSAGTFEVRFGPLTLSLPLSYIEVLNRPEVDRYPVAALSGTGNGALQLQLALATNEHLETFTNVALPDSPPPLSTFESNQFFVYVGQGPNNFVPQISARPIHTLHAAVPEPSTLMLCVSAIAILLMARSLGHRHSRARSSSPITSHQDLVRTKDLVTTNSCDFSRPLCWQPRSDRFWLPVDHLPRAEDAGDTAPAADDSTADGAATGGLMGFEKFPHIPNLGPIIERKISEGIIDWVKSKKGGPPPGDGALDPPRCRKLFPHMYSVYVVSLTGSLHRCHSDQEAMQMTTSAIQPGASIDDYEVLSTNYRGHHACLVNPGDAKRHQWDDERKKYGLKVPDDPSFYGYIFDPWMKKAPKVYTIQNWYSSF